MRVRILGSAAGGGFPQWNCNCDNCRRLRAGSLHGKARSQSSIAVSADGIRWCLVNASPDVRSQLMSCSPASPQGETRTTTLCSVMLTDAELDHTAGLLSLREAQALPVYSSAAVFNWVFELNRAFGALIQTGRLTWRKIENRSVASIETVEGDDIGLGYEACFVPGKIPRYAGTASSRTDGSTVALRFFGLRGGGSLLYMPCALALDEAAMSAIKASDCVLLDGSFWWEDEMARRGAGEAMASSMGHLAINGPGGSLAALRDLGGIRKIYTHVNNTNPILDEDSDERRILAVAGFEVAEDGMELDL